MQTKIKEALTAREIVRCFPVMRQLRTHFENEETFLAQVERQRREGYRMAFLEDDHAVRAVAGFRRLEMLHAGRHYYVDDLVTDAAGRFAHYKVIDPSFHNWVGLMMALRDQQISDFPLCNKSFNLSYCGHDL